VSAVLFFVGAIGAIAGAIGVVLLRDPFYSVLSLVGHLLSLAVLFLLLRAELVAAVQVVVYAGAVMVLYVFVVAYVGGEEASLSERLRGSGVVGSGLRAGAAIAGAALLAELLIVLLGTGLSAIHGYGAPYRSGPRAFGTPAYIGRLLLTRYLLAFEIASFLLLVAAVGAVVLAGRGHEEEGMGVDGTARYAARSGPQGAPPGEGAEPDGESERDDGGSEQPEGAAMAGQR
jgi:NADH:ubiquinone oxidoreductase subunit 6 (subunit J)